MDLELLLLYKLFGNINMIFLNIFQFYIRF